MSKWALEKHTWAQQRQFEESLSKLRQGGFSHIVIDPPSKIDVAWYAMDWLMEEFKQELNKDYKILLDGKSARHWVFKDANMAFAFKMRWG